MDVQQYAGLMVRAIVTQLATANLNIDRHYRIVNMVDAPRCVRVEVQVNHSCIQQFGEARGRTWQFSQAIRQVTRSDEPLPVRFTNGPNGTVALEVAKPKELWVTVPVSAIRPKTGVIVPVGVGADGQTEVIDFANPITPHGLVAGVPGSGKTNEMLALVRFLALQNTPAEVKFLFIDVSMKRGYDFTAFARVAHRADDIITDPERAAEALRWTVGEMERRGEMGYNTPHLFLFIDEVIDLVQQKPEITPSLVSITRTGRALGVHLVLVAQNPSKNNLRNRDIVAYVPTRLVGKVADHWGASIATGQAGTGAEQLTGSGDILLVSPAQESIKRIIAPLVTTADLAGLLMADTIEPFEFAAETKLTTADSRWTEPKRGRPADAYDWEKVGQFAVYLARCRQAGQTPLAPSTLGRGMTPMWGADKVKRHLRVAEKVYTGIHGAGYEIRRGI